MTEPVRVGEVLPEVVAEAIARAGPGYDRWMEQVASTGYCTHPVRLRSCYLDDLDLADLARRAEHLRGTTRPDAPTLRLLDGTA